MLIEAGIISSYLCIKLPANLPYPIPRLIFPAVRAELPEALVIRHESRRVLAGQNPIIVAKA